MAEAVRNDGQGSKNNNMIYNTETGKWQVVPATQAPPREGLVVNEMTREGFAS